MTVPPTERSLVSISRTTNAIGEGLVSFELVLYAAVGLLLGAAGVLILVGSVSALVRSVTTAAERSTRHRRPRRVLLALIVGELLYTLRFVVRTHEIAVEPFLYIGIIAVVRRILIVTAQFERSPQSGHALTNTLLEFGLLGVLVPALAVAVFLVRRRHVVVRRLDASEARAELDALADVLHDCVANGASIGFMHAVHPRGAVGVLRGRRPRDRRRHAHPARRLRRRRRSSGRCRSSTPGSRTSRTAPTSRSCSCTAARAARASAGQLMEAAEREAAADGKTLLVLDTVTGSAAYRLVPAARLGRGRGDPRLRAVPRRRPCATTVFYKRVTVSP